MNIKIIGKCIKSTKPMLKPEQVGNSKAFIVNDEKEEYEEYDVEEVINSLKDYLSKQQYNYSIHLIKNWKDTNVLHKLMSITLRENNEIQDIKHKKLWNIYKTWIFDTMLKELKYSPFYKGMSTSREGWQSDKNRPYYWGCKIDGYIFAYGYTHPELSIDTMISKKY